MDRWIVMDQIERIRYFESLLNEADAVLKQFHESSDAYIGIQKKISQLDHYYASREWKQDFEASEQGELPEDLLCGVLSEDGIDDLLEDNLQLIAELESAAAELRQQTRS